MSSLPNQKEDYAAWYSEVIKQAELAEHSPVRGCMIIKPYGFALWEKIKEPLDKAFKATGHQNAYFPLLIPASFFQKEANHVEGFAKECAVVTHYRLKSNPEGKLDIDPYAKLEDPLIIRPTSETVIWDSFKRWIRSYRDLPLLTNQWANVVRWEMRTRPFLRTSEFLWQEGHTAHATQKEALAETKQMLGIYAQFMQEKMGLSLVIGKKTAHERFAGAEETFTLEALMQDAKALQLGTSHFLGQNFARAFDVTFATAEGKLELVWGTSWGVTTRLIGALIMTHSDEKGLVLPPALAPIQVGIVPIVKKDCNKEALLSYAKNIKEMLIKAGYVVDFDPRDDAHPGRKFTAYERKGIPICLAIGPRDVEQQQIEVKRRDNGSKQFIPLDQLIKQIKETMEAIQKALYARAEAFRKANTTHVDTWTDFQEVMKTQRGFVMAHWDGTTATECAIKEATKATIRCIPLSQEAEEGKCIFSGKPSKGRVLFAQAY